MSLVPSLLQAIVSLDGEALVIHVGEKPYVVSPTGQVELATRGLTLEAVNGIVEQLLPSETQQALEEFGAIQYEIPSATEFRHEHFTVVAARGGDDVWVEIRRRQTPDDDAVPVEMFATSEPLPAHDPPQMGQVEEEDLEVPEPEHLWPAPPLIADPPPLKLPASIEIDPLPRPALHIVPPPPEVEEPAAFEELEIELPSTFEAPPIPATHIAAVEPSPVVAESPPPPPIAAPPLSAAAPPPRPVTTLRPPTAPIAAPHVPPPPPEEHIVAVAETPEPEPAPVSIAAAPPPEPAPAAVEPPPPPIVAAPPPPPVVVPPPPIAVVPPSIAPAPPIAAVPPPLTPAPTPHPAIVVPMTRSPIRSDAPPLLVTGTVTGIDRLLRVAAARGASTLYLASQARPSIRVDGEIQMLDEPALGTSEVESLLIDLMPERNREALRSGMGTEWICDVAEVGRVRCMTFRDHRGAGGIFRMMPVRAISADQLGLSREIQALAGEAEGLVLVAGPRSSGKSTLLSAFVDLINRSRRDHVITVETEIKVVHENRSSLVSQREVRGDNDEMLAVIRSAIRENPDVLVIEDLRSADVVTAVLDAANSGHLVIAALPAHTSTGAVDRIIDLYTPDDRRHVQLALAESLRGIVAQVLVRKPGGGRLAAREVLLNTPAVASVIAEGKTSQLPLTLESGRRHGMVALNDALVGYVQTGAIEAREGYRRAADRQGFLALLKRQGIDTSFVERLA